MTADIKNLYMCLFLQEPPSPLFYSTKYQDSIKNIYFQTCEEQANVKFTDIVQELGKALKDPLGKLASRETQGSVEAEEEKVCANH